MSKPSLATDSAYGMAVDPATAAHRSVYEGKTYHFCSAGCKASFDEDPAQHAAKGKPAA